VYYSNELTDETRLPLHLSFVHACNVYGVLAINSIGTFWFLPASNGVQKSHCSGNGSKGDHGYERWLGIYGYLMAFEKRFARVMGGGLKMDLRTLGEHFFISWCSKLS
jgi:hypothetical protein